MNRLLWGMVVLVLAAGCGENRSAEPGATGLEFWHTRTGAMADSLKAIVDAFNRGSGGPPIVPVYVRGYPDVRTKVMAGIQARRLPLLSVCYESQVQEYAAAGVVQPLDPFVKEAAGGLSPAELADFYPQFLETNRFARFGGQLLSFPFTKSLLVLYRAATLLESLGFDKPPATWEAFRAQARAAREKTGRTPYPLEVDASTLDGMIFSYGGDVLGANGKTTTFDQPPTVRMLTLLRDLAQDKLATETPGQNIVGLFASGQVPFSLGSSSHRREFEQQVASKFEWDLGIIPHADGVPPVTVMYGPNICLFKAGTDHEQLGWRFIKFFTSPPITARWARETGYLPVRKTAAELPEMQAFWKENPRALHAFELLPAARVEPNVPGWDEVRNLLEDAARKAIHDRGTPEQIARELKRKADAALAAGG
jgi:multiple sugar transport system substrate-binding protein